MNREDRLRAALGGTGLEDQVCELARLPVADVNLIVQALRASRRAGRADERDIRRRRRDNRRKHGWVEADQVADAADQLVARSLVPRAGLDLDALARLKRHYDDGPAMLALAVAGARAQGYTDTQIAEALGVHQTAVGKRFGSRDGSYAPEAG